MKHFLLGLVAVSLSACGPKATVYDAIPAEPRPEPVAKAETAPKPFTGFKPGKWGWGEFAELRRPSDPKAMVPYFIEQEYYQIAYDDLVAGREQEMDVVTLGQLHWMPAGMRVKVLSTMEKTMIELTIKDAKMNFETVDSPGNRSDLERAEQMRPWVKIRVLYRNGNETAHQNLAGFVPEEFLVRPSK